MRTPWIPAHRLKMQQFSFWLLSVNGRFGRARRSVARRLDCFRIVKEAAIGARRSDAPYHPQRPPSARDGATRPTNS